MRIHFSTQDFGRIRFATQPAPLIELNLALLNLISPTASGTATATPAATDPLTTRWRQSRLRALPPALPLRALIDDPDAWTHRTPPAAAHRQAFDAVLAPHWQAVQDLHRAEFTRHALAVAEYGIAQALATLPHARLTGATLELDLVPLNSPHPDNRADPTDPGNPDIVLLPHFHGPPRTYATRPKAPGGQLVIAYPAGPGPARLGESAHPTDGALADVIGHTRHRALLLLTEAHTTGDLARRLEISNATASAHATALRAAGLIASTRTGRTVLHECTALGSLLVHCHRRRPA